MHIFSTCSKVMAVFMVSYPEKDISGKDMEDAGVDLYCAIPRGPTCNKGTLSTRGPFQLLLKSIGGGRGRLSIDFRGYGDQSLYSGILRPKADTSLIFHITQVTDLPVTPILSFIICVRLKQIFQTDN